MGAKRAETIIKVTTEPPSMRFDDYAIETRRERSQIDKAVKNGSLNWGKANGVKSIILDELSTAYTEKCRAADNLKRKLKG